MADINITFAEVRTKASEIRGLNADLTTKLAEIQSEIKKLEADWTSDASVEIRSKITNLQTRFDEYQQIIEEYAKFLDDWNTNHVMLPQSYWKGCLKFREVIMDIIKKLEENPEENLTFDFAAFE